RAVMLATDGTPKARVLPEPVGARPSTSRPASPSAIVAAWMANGVVIPRAASASQMKAGTPSCANERAVVEDMCGLFPARVRRGQHQGVRGSGRFTVTRGTNARLRTQRAQRPDVEHTVTNDRPVSSRTR